MRLLIVSSVFHNFFEGKIYGYGPYIREMNLWAAYADEVVVLGHRKDDKNLNPIDAPYVHHNLKFVSVPSFNILSLFNVLRSLCVSPIIVFKLFKHMRTADHIHFRCPANLGLMGLFVQVFFPNTKKSTKYAGNWDPNSNQPKSYRLQQSILRSTFFSRHMKTLVYGQWPNESKNIHPFISATYTESEKIAFRPRDYSKPLHFVFAGALVVGKRPLFTIKIIEALNKKGMHAVLDMFGDGPLMPELELYVKHNDLEKYIILHGNQDKSVVKAALLDAHFNILPSKSEGWPKAVAEGMFFGSIPIATSVSCVSWMLADGKRGILIKPNLESAIVKIEEAIKNDNLEMMAKAAMKWSQQYTFDRLEHDIKNILLS
ncbi:glycosyltransferase family 4 protein [Ichthyenterobacterium magnum]|uniref:Glycosyltransferase involved in cell wall biosynthesis n=1 Tax=Ichthyenterobacterium magnum TaxID=1230530 RepID=A0A420DUN6_9FLAO|nr:glycosyltransferase [Ichthyenterobacterium magnum]RKE97972.1 glycosyltransferase involved in cell wall biosynthesis [Ichthyenterobacterium magnum]